MIEMLITQTPEYLSSPDQSQKLFDFMDRIIFDILAMTSENKQLTDLTKLYIDMLSRNDTQVMNLIDKRILYNVENKNKDEKNFFDSLISNMDKDVRELSSTLLTFIVNRLFEMGNHEMIDKIMSIVFGLIPEEASKNWLKIHQFLSVSNRLLIHILTNSIYSSCSMLQRVEINNCITWFITN